MAAILAILRATPADMGARLAVLRFRLDELRALHLHLETAGDDHPSVALLGEVLLKIEALAATVPDDAAVCAVWSDLEKAFAAYLGEDAAEGESRRDDFWK
jgi:hypothetical protein